MIELASFGIQYPGAATAVLRQVDLHIDEGELALVAGHTGTGKSTLLRALNGLVPHFTGGHVEGRVRVCGVDTRTTAPRELAHLVGYVGQDPLAGFVTDSVEEELAYGMEQQAVAPRTMRRRIEETLDLLGIAALRDRPLRTLSGGEQQRVAIGAALTLHPQVLVLDEPTSALDPTAAEDALSAVLRLVHDLGLTVVVAEHRLERIVHYADRLVLVHGDGRATSGAPAELLIDSPVAPPVVQLGRLAGWRPLPLSVRDARRSAGPLRTALVGTSVPPVRGVAPDGRLSTPQLRIEVSGLVVRHGGVFALRGVGLTATAGEVVVVMGRNGSGKSSLLWALQGGLDHDGGRVLVDGRDPNRLSRREVRSLVALVPQTAADLLYLDTVRAECRQADLESSVRPGTCRRLLESLLGGGAGGAGGAHGAGSIDDDTHPRDLSEGQRLLLVLAVQIAGAPGVVLLDEPTRGLDYGAKARLCSVVTSLAGQGGTVVIATHDVEFAAAVADRVVVLADGDVVADGPAVEVLVASPTFAPQTAKILGPAPWLTVGQVAAALGVAAALDAELAREPST